MSGRQGGGPGRTLVAATALVMAALACWAEARATAPPETVRVITHTREYCEELSGRAAALLQRALAPLEEARLLSAEGDRLCGQGQIRPGIIRLRRAIMLLRAQGRQEGRPEARPEARPDRPGR